MTRKALQIAGLAAAAAAAALLISLDGSDAGHASGGYYPGQGSSAPADGITVLGTGSVAVERPAQRTDRTIRAAVDTARRAAYRKAVDDARVSAAALASATGIGLGPIEAVAETQDPYSAGLWGRFGNGRYCGTISRRVFGRDASGRRTVRRVVRRHSCIVPRRSAVTLTLRYGKD